MLASKFIELIQDNITNYGDLPIGIDGYEIGEWSPKVTPLNKGGNVERKKPSELYLE